MARAVRGHTCHVGPFRSTGSLMAPKRTFPVLRRVAQLGVIIYTELKLNLCELREQVDIKARPLKTIKNINYDPAIPRACQAWGTAGVPMGGGDWGGLGPGAVTGEGLTWEVGPGRRCAAWVLARGRRF